MAPWIGRVCESVSGLCFSVCCDGAAHSRPSGPVMVIRVGVLCSIRLGVFAFGYFSLLRLFGCLRALSFVFCQSLFLSVRTTFSCHFFRFLENFFHFCFTLFSLFFHFPCQRLAHRGWTARKKKFSFESSAHLGAEMFRTRRSEAVRRPPIFLPQINRGRLKSDTRALNLLGFTYRN